MKKIFLFLLVLCFVGFPVFSQGVTKKKSATQDSYTFELYLIDTTKREFRDSFGFYVRLVSEDSEEYFTWCFTKLNEAMEHFKWLEKKVVIHQGLRYDNRDYWRVYAYDAEIRSNNYIHYWISKEHRIKAYGYGVSWR